MNLKNSRINIAKGIWINLCRFILAFVFIFSGFVKAVDPLGTQYKIEDYLEAFGINSFFPPFFPLSGALCLAFIEFALGVYFLFGIRKQFSTWSIFILLAFMTPFTLYLAIKNPVSDCGCFGDAFIFTNWETFWKNVLLLIASLSVLIGKARIIRLVSEKMQWLVSLYTFLFIIGISMYCLYYLPIFDFRPYKIGVNIPQSMIIPEGAKGNVYETIFVLEKEGVEKEFTLENYPDSTWTFVDSKTILKEKGYEPPIHDFSMVSIEDGKDMTEQVLAEEGYTFLLIAHQMDSAEDSDIDLINEIYDYSMEKGYAFYCLTSSLEDQIEEWKDKTGAEYPFCQTDNITLKTMIRSNPGLILIKNGVIVNKWSHHNLPDEYVLNGNLNQLSVGKLKSISIFHTFTQVILWFTLPLLFLIAIDIWWMQRKKGKLGRKMRAEEK